jgi:hypothetical protein
VVLAIVVAAVAKLSVEDSQRMTFPIFPVKVKVPLFKVTQTVALPETLPPTDVGFTVIVATDEFAVAQLPLWTTAR